MELCRGSGSRERVQKAGEGSVAELSKGGPGLQVRKSCLQGRMDSVKHSYSFSLIRSPAADDVTETRLLLSPAAPGRFFLLAEMAQRRQGRTKGHITASHRSGLLTIGVRS